MADEKWLYWVCKECPLSDDCKPESFKRAKVWAETKEEAMAKLVQHLVHSSHHNIPEEDAEQLATEATFEHEDWTSSKPAQGRLTSPKRRPAETADDVQPRRSNRSRSPPVLATASKASGSAPGPAAKAVNTRINQEGAGTVFVEVLEHCAALMKDFKKPQKPPPQQQLELATTTPRAAAGGDILMVPAEKIKHAIDSLGRGITAATHAQRLALAAANSFSVEVEVLTDVKKTLEAVMTVGSGD